MTAVLSVTAPIYLLIAAGFASVLLGRLAPTDMRVLGRFAAKFCVPALLFRALANQSIESVWHTDYVVVYACGSLVALTTIITVSRIGLRRPWSLAVMQGLGSSGSNSSFIGYPIVHQVIGPTAGIALALCTVVENLLVMPLALILADSGDASKRPRDLLVATATGIIHNPMILAIGLGMVVSALGWAMPPVLDRAVALAAAAAPPTALFVIGGSLVGLRLAGMKGDLALVATGKLVLHPLCVLLVGLVLPIDDPKLYVCAVLFAAMPMLSIYPVLAQRYGHDRLCAAALLAATVGSFVSITALVGLVPLAATLPTLHQPIF